MYVCVIMCIYINMYMYMWAYISTNVYMYIHNIIPLPHALFELSSGDPDAAGCRWHMMKYEEKQIPSGYLT